MNNATNATETTDLRPEASTGIEAWAGSQNHATPTQLYESFFYLAMAAFLVWATAKDILPRQKLKLYWIC